MNRTMALAGTAWLMGFGAVTAREPLPEVERGPAPGWVEDVENGVPTAPAAGSEIYLLSDTQHHLEENTRYEARALRILNETGVEEHSQLSIDFQPEYETLRFHELRIERDGEVLDRLPAAEIELLRREEGMEYRLYDGDLTALVILKDVRPGDILSYAYSIRGSNPVFGGRTHGFSGLGFDPEVAALHSRVLWDPEQRGLRWKIHGGGPSPEVSGPRNDGLRELSVSLRPAPRVRVEPRTPAWRFDYPWLEYSDYADWSEFGAWGRGIYGTSTELPRELREVCADIREEAESDEEIILGALTWAKRNVRYLGSFMGKHTHAPYPLEMVLERRFGDCKDKGMLTTAMLRHLGFDAAAAVVNTGRHRGVRAYLPGHSGFTHLIVHLKWRGEDYWLDPTYTYQRGPLDELHVPDYGYAYVFRPGEKDLRKVEPRGREVDRIVVEERFTVDDTKGGADLVVETTATGAEANSLRAYFAGDPARTISESYRDYYASLYPGIETAAPLRMNDDETANLVVVREQYRIPQLWQPLEDDPACVVFELQARYLGAEAPQPTKQSRTQPFANPFPNNVRQILDVELPETWDTEPDRVEIERPAFRYWSEVRPRDRGFRIVYDFEALAPTVPADEFEAYQAATEELQDDLYYYVSHETPGARARTGGDTVPASGGSPFSAVGLLSGVAAAGLVVGILFATLLFFWDPPARAIPDGAPHGLGGWLALVMIGVLLQPLVITGEGASFFLLLGDMAAVLESGEHAFEWRLYYGLAVFCSAFLLPLAVLLVVLFFRKRSSFPWLFIATKTALLATSVLILSVESVVPDIEEGDDRAVALARSIVFLLVWGSYMIRSRRVRGTFVRRRRRTGPPALPVVGTSGVRPAPAATSPLGTSSLDS